MNRYFAAGIFLFCAAVYFLSPARVVMDSHYSMLLSENIGRHHAFALDRYFTHPERHWPGTANGTNLSYHVYQHAGHTYYAYPPGSSVLSVPIVLAANAAGLSASHPRNGYSTENELRIERGGAALVTALAVVFIFLAASQFLGAKRALIAALVTAFGTGFWSTASRVMWTHTWGVCLLGAALFLLAIASREGAKLRPALLASVLAWLYFTRPTFSLSIIAITIYVIAKHRRDFVVFAATGAAWLAAFIAFSYATSGHFLHPYFRQGGELVLWNFPRGLFGVLASPSRGLLVYSPVSLIAGWFAVRSFAMGRAANALVVLASAAIALHLAALAAWPMWYGGFGYGARLPTDIAPWLALLVAVGWSTWPVVSKPVGFIAGILVPASIAMQAIGAFSMDAWRWNIEPDNIVQHDARLWDWHDAQFLRPFVSKK